MEGNAADPWLQVLDETRSKEKAVGATGLAWVANRMARNLVKRLKLKVFLARSLGICGAVW